MTVPDGAFTVRRRIRFGQSDPAGIVYFPAFFDMFNDLFEDWMIDCLGVDFPAEFRDHQRMYPLVHVSADFKEARSMGQTMDLSLVLHAVGRSSIRYTIVGSDGDLEILRADCVTCVASKTTQKSIAVPDDIRKRMEAYLAACGVPA